MRVRSGSTCWQSLVTEGSGTLLPNSELGSAKTASIGNCKRSIVVFLTGRSGRATLAPNSATASWFRAEKILCWIFLVI